jgi:hypothetical protein
MSFRIVEIIDAKPDGIVATVSHQNHLIPAIILNQGEDNLAVGTSFRASISFDRILDWKTIDDFKDAQSGIWQEQDGIHLLGRVHSVLDYGDGKTIIDVYMQNGPEFFQVDAETIRNDDLEPNSGLEIIVGSLYIDPTDHR